MKEGLDYQVIFVEKGLAPPPIVNFLQVDVKINTA